MRAVQTLDSNDASIALDEIWTVVRAKHHRCVVAVADAHGDLLMLRRADGASPSSVAIASNKAWTAAREGVPTLAIGTRIREGGVDTFDIAYYGDPRYVGWGGGVPVIIQGQVAGSIAVSGLPEREDHALAEIGVRILVERLSRSGS